MTETMVEKKETHLTEKKSDSDQPKVESPKEIKVEKKTETKVESPKEERVEKKTEVKVENKVNQKSKKKSWISRLNKKSKSTLTDEEKNALLEDAKISLWIDSYEEIFSDFDPRGYSKREISADFLSEAKRFSRERLDGKVELVILIPASIVNKSVESVIRKRLMQSFLQQYNILLEKKNKIIKQGVVFVLLGIFFMVSTTFILFNHDVKDFFIYFLGVIGEPAGWFLFWEGLNLIIFDSKGKKPDLDFNKKMLKINIVFKSYD